MFAKNTTKNKGFTLVELLVVIAIIAILSVTGYVALGGQTGKARDSRRQSDISSIQNALEIYFINNNSNYPSSIYSAPLPGESPFGEVMPTVPYDPWSSEGDNVEYLYVPDGNNRTYELAATLEGDDGVLRTYLVGNATTDLILNGYDPNGGTPGSAVSCDFVNNSTTCLPYWR